MRGAFGALAMAEVVPLNPSKASRLKDLYDIGEIPPLGHVPAKMHAWAIRKERHGPPEQLDAARSVPTWPIGEDEVLVFVMAAGVNYNGVWAGLGKPISPLDGHKHPFHIAGSDASGIVWAVGSKVKRWKVGDEVIVHCNQDDGDDEECNGGDPLLSPSQRIWGYETPDGSFAQFCRVQSRQLMPKPKHLHLGRGGLLHADARHRLSHAVRPCAAHAQARRQRAGLGRLRRARRVRRAACAASGANAIGVISDEIEARLRASTSAPRASSTARTSSAGARCRRSNSPEYNDWTKEARKFGKAIWDITGKRDVDIVFEHPGEADVPGLVPGGEARRHGGVLRRHHRLQHHLRRALRLDAAEAHPGLALRASEAGLAPPTSSCSTAASIPA